MDMGTRYEKAGTVMERVSDCETVVTRTFDAPVPRVWQAWTQDDLFQQWWVPKSAPATLLSCKKDVRTGGKYRLEFAFGDNRMEFFGAYLDVVPNQRMVWTNAEDPNGSVTTVTMEEQSGRTQLTLHERYPTRDALEESLGAIAFMPETFAQLDALLAKLSG
jgi:uncharacterized protein YndB with AHSA1/START domain